MTTPEERPLRAGLTPAQTVGPFLHIGLAPTPGLPGPPDAVRIVGTVRDGDGVPVGDALVETWQVAAGDGDARGFTRSWTGPDGTWEAVVPRPVPLPTPDGAATEAPHLDVSVFARGLLDRVVTRVYLPEDAAVEGPGGHAQDPVLRRVPASRRSTLVAVPAGAHYRFDIRLQGEGETVFFDL